MSLGGEGGVEKSELSHVNSASQTQPLWDQRVSRGGDRMGTKLSLLEASY